MVSVACAVAFAQNVASDFKIDPNGTITKYEGWGTAVVIPETINGVWVTAIGHEAFTKNDLTSVTILNNVTFISSFAFPSEFTSVYNANSKKAGTYTYSNNKWSLN